MSTGTDTETKVAVEQEQNKIKLPIIDFKNEWLNRDKELYTVIFAKTGLSIALFGVNVLLGSDTLQRASVRSLSSIFSGLFEMAYVSGNRILINGIKNKYPDSLATFIILDVVFGTLIYSADIVGNAAILGFEMPQLPLPPILAVPPALVNLAFPQQVMPTEPYSSLEFLQDILNMFNGFILVGGAITVAGGSLASQFI
jgi:hypothetical protein